MEYHEIAGMFPMMSAEERAELKASIKNDGYDNLHPIMLFGGKILDGRNRYEVCVELDVQFPTEEYVDDDPVGFVIKENLTRRHLDQGQRAAIAAEMLPLYEKYKPHGGDRKSEEYQVDKNVHLKDRPRKQAAESVGVGEVYVQEAKHIKERNEDVFEHVKNKKLNIPTAKALVDLDDKDVEEVLESMKKDNLSNKEVQQVVKEKRLKAQGIQSPKFSIALYGDNIYFSHIKASDKRWDDHVIDQPEYPTLTRWSRLYKTKKTEN